MLKNEEVQAVYNLPRVKQFIDKKNTRSIKTAQTYLSAIVKLNRYVRDTYGKDANTIIDYLTEEPKQVYDLLDGYSTYLQSEKEGITAKTVDTYIAGLRSYFAKYDIDVVTAKFKSKVTLPSKVKEKEVPIDASDIRKILLQCHNPRMKAYILFLASSGLRAGRESCSIRNCDVDFNSNPTKVHLRGDYAKTKTTRDTYLTDEATHYLKEFIESRGETDKEQLLFTVQDKTIPRTSKDISRAAFNLYTRLNINFIELLKEIGNGMDARKENGLIHKKRHAITLHSFRRFIYSIIEEQVNTGFANYILGHSDSPYHTQKESKIKELYITKCMPVLTILDYSAIEATGKNIQDRIDQKDAQIASLNNQIMKLGMKQDQLEFSLGAFKKAFAFRDGSDEMNQIIEEYIKEKTA